jgi:hypothetical protein
MRGATKGFLITAGIWVLLLLAYAGIETVRGHAPFAMFTWNPGGKFVTATVLLVLALGTAVGVASDRIQSRSGR